MTIVQVAEAGQSDGVFIGVIRDASTGAGIEGAVVIVTGEKLQGERTATTDSSGVYRVPNLPPGVYDLAVLHKDYGEGKRRKGLQLRANTTIRVDISLQPAGAGEVREIIVPAPTVDVGSSSTGLSIDKEMAKRVPIVAPGGKGSVTRSFESVAEATPGAKGDTYGTSIAGATSPENQYTVDGMSVNNPAYGINGSGLSVEFLEEVKVEAGGYMPEFGRSTGGVINATTKRGSNELHGNVWAFYTPGQLEGRRLIPPRAGDTIITERLLNWQGDTGFDIGGKIIKDKLWFYGGFQIGRQVYNLRSSWYRQVVDPDTGEIQVDDATGFNRTERIAGTTRINQAAATSISAIGKLTYSPRKNHTIDLTGIFLPVLSGSGTTYGMNASTGLPEVGTLNGDFTALAHRYRDNATDVMAKWSATSPDKNWLFDTTFGWHHQIGNRLPSDGSRVGSGNGLANVPGIIYRSPSHSFTDFQSLPGGAPNGACDPFMAPGAMDATVVCPIRTYSAGGPGFIYERTLDRLHGRHMVTRFLQGAGHHLIKAGLDAEYIQYTNNRAYSGGTLYRENVGGTSFTDYRQQGFLVAPDDPRILGNIQYTTFATTIGAFLQDSWSIMDKVTVNAGLRYDAQYLFSADRLLALALPNQVSPRLGFIWDPTYQGKAKLFANYARFYQSVPLDIADRAGSGEPGFASIHPKTLCDPTDMDMHEGVCRTDASRLQVGGPTEPDQYWIPLGGNKTPVDPKIKPQSTDEIVGGAEYEIFTDGRLGLIYTKRWMNRVIEDMSRDEATTYFIGNPGHGIASDFPKVVRDY
ncbi:MAG TPA: TonB-dependent receptor, partial [Nannocystaceae bacterium]|nr:TonB-dependent receptor [Nannocystaceae bacterium]